MTLTKGQAAFDGLLRGGESIMAAELEARGAVGKESLTVRFHGDNYGDSRPIRVVGPVSDVRFC